MSYSQTKQSKADLPGWGQREYKLTYYTPDYTPKDTDILQAAFRLRPSPVFRLKEGWALYMILHGYAWTTVWTDLLTDVVATRSLLRHRTGEDISTSPCCLS